MTTFPKLSRVSSSIVLTALLFAQDGAVAQEHLFTLNASDRLPGDEFGISVAVSGQLAIIGADGNSDLGTWSGSAYLFDLQAGQQLFNLHASDGQQSDLFGYSVGISGDRAIVGAYGKSNVTSFYQGAAYLFDTATGQQTFKLRPAGLSPGDYFGYSVSIDGDYAVIGTPGDGVAGVFSGAAYIYHVPSGQKLHKLTPADGAPFNSFGISVAVSGDRAIIGAYYDNDMGNNAGAAYVYDVTNGQMVFKLHAGNGAAEDFFGCSVAMDGPRAVIGAYGKDVGATGIDAGSAYVFNVSTGTQITELIPPDGAQADNFGRSVALSDGRAVVGANNDDDLGSNSGSAYVFDAGTGQMLFKLLADNGTASDQFGWSVGADSGRTVAGAYVRENSRGTAYAYSLVEPGVGYCFGDPGSGAPCPCANDNDGSVPGSGCDNGVFASGGHLGAAGLASISADSLLLSATHVEPNNTGLFFQANLQVNNGWGNPFGDGLRCAGGGLIRLQIVSADSAGTARTTIPISVKGGNSEWDIRRYQYWYRSNTNPPCGSGINDFNLTNGYEVMWLP